MVVADAFAPGRIVLLKCGTFLMFLALRWVLVSPITPIAAPASEPGT